MLAINLSQTVWKKHMAEDKKEITLVGLRGLCEFPSFYILTRYFVWFVVKCDRLEKI